MRAEKFFSEAEKERIHQAVIDAETRTSGEIVPMIVTASARYTEVELLAVIVGVFAGALTGWLLHDPWASPYFYLWPVIGATAGFFLGRIPAVKRSLVSNARMEQAVDDQCLAAFTRNNLHYTREHSGVLIFASLLEHRVEVLADRGIAEKVEPGTWEEIVSILTAGLKSGRACDAFCQAIARCGEILATHFPRRDDDRDELPNKLVTEP